MAKVQGEQKRNRPNWLSSASVQVCGPDFEKTCGASVCTALFNRRWPRVIQGSSVGRGECWGSGMRFGFASSLKRAVRTKCLASWLRLLFCALLLGPGLSRSQLHDPPEAGAYRHVTHGRIEIGGHEVSYDALTEESFLVDEHGKRAASLVSTTYLRTGQGAMPNRPVVFVFNGGPGSSSLWLHLGLVGPRRVDLDGVRGDGVNPPTTPPFRLVDNADSILDVADLVIYDPVGTGFSRILPEGKPEEFYGVQQDARALADFIRDWSRRHDRTNSPRYLMGESYGSVRAAVTARLLAGGPSVADEFDAMPLNGVILLGQLLNHVPESADQTSLELLPSLAATAWYHTPATQRADTLEQRVNAARNFAASDYLRALFAGSALSPIVKADIAARLSALTGVSVTDLMARDLRLTAATLNVTRFAQQGQSTGVYDSRYIQIRQIGSPDTLPDDPVGEDPVADDAAMGQYAPGFIAGNETYLRKELGVKMSLEYRAIVFRSVNARWDYGLGPAVPNAVDYTPDIAAAMRRNPAMRLFVGIGYYDLVTPLGSAEYTILHSGIEPDA
jgi:carboxypeptidase C (cathepsin A)